MVWSFVLLFVIGLLLFGFLLDRKTDRYKEINDRKEKEGLEAIKDDVQKHNPPNSNHTGPW